MPGHRASRPMAVEQLARSRHVDVSIWRPHALRPPEVLRCLIQCISDRHELVPFGRASRPDGARRPGRRRVAERRGGRRHDARPPAPERGARLLVPEGGERPARHAARLASRDARVFALDTHVLFPETYDVWRAGRAALRHRGRGLPGAVARPAGRSHGDALWERNPTLCCAIRKVGPLATGARRSRRLDHGHAPRAVRHACRRAEARLGRSARAVEGEPARRLDATTTSGRTSASATCPYNPLHERGYASIGCTHCTQPGEGREGRWAGTDKTECGLHA